MDAARHPATIAEYPFVVYEIGNDPNLDQFVRDTVTAHFESSAPFTSRDSLRAILDQHRRAGHETLVIGASEFYCNKALALGAAFIYLADFLAYYADDGDEEEGQPDGFITFS